MQRRWGYEAEDLQPSRERVAKMARGSHHNTNLIYGGRGLSRGIAITGFWVVVVK